MGHRSGSERSRQVRLFSRFSAFQSRVKHHIRSRPRTTRGNEAQSRGKNWGTMSLKSSRPISGYDDSEIIKTCLMLTRRPFGVPFENVYLVRLHNVSSASWQPELWYKTSTTSWRLHVPATYFYSFVYWFIVTSTLLPCSLLLNSGFMTLLFVCTCCYLMLFSLPFEPSLFRSSAPLSS